MKRYVLNMDVDRGRSDVLWDPPRNRGSSYSWLAVVVPRAKLKVKQKQSRFDS